MDDRRRGWLLAASGMLLVSTDSFFIRWSEAEAALGVKPGFAAPPG